MHLRMPPSGSGFTIFSRRLQVSNPSSEDQLQAIWASFTQASFACSANWRIHTHTFKCTPSHSNIILISQTCFCCVLAAQLAESTPVPQLGRRDEIAAEMLKVLTKPFMVRPFPRLFPSHRPPNYLLPLSPCATPHLPACISAVFARHAASRPASRTRTMPQKCVPAC